MMIRTERNKTGIVIGFILLVFSLALCAWITIDLIRNETDNSEILLLSAGIFSVLISVYIVVAGYREYELTESGITMHSVFHFQRYFPWEIFPYCYVIFFWDNKAGPHSEIVFSKTMIDHKKGKKIRYGFLSKPYSVICIGHTQERVDEIRALRPELQIEYRNAYLAKGQRKHW